MAGEFRVAGSTVKKGTADKAPPAGSPACQGYFYAAVRLC